MILERFGCWQSENQEMGIIIIFGTVNKKYWIDQIITIHNCIKKVNSRTGISIWAWILFWWGKNKNKNGNILRNMVNVSSAKPISINNCLFLSDICKFVPLETLVFAWTMKIFALPMFHSAKGNKGILGKSWEVFVDLEYILGYNLITKTLTRSR